jgi:hypothetical protein
MKTSKLLIALSILCLMLGACASTNDDNATEPSLSDSQTNGDQIPSHAARQDDIAYTDISRNPEVPKIVDTTTTVDRSTAEQTGITNDQSMTSSSTTDNTTMSSTDPQSTTGTSTTGTNTTGTSTMGTSSSSNLNNNNTTGTSSSSMTSSSTTDDTNATNDTTDQSETASRTRLRKD